MTEYKIVIVGSGGVGKSALTIQYIQETFIEKYDPTIEDSYRKQVDVNGSAVMLDILDTAGQEEYSAMRFEYMSKGHGFIIVYSLTDPQSFEDCTEIHADLLKSKDADENSKIPIILAANKCDLEEERTLTREEGEELAQSFGNYCKFMETSAKERINVDEIFEELVMMINRVEENEPYEPEEEIDQVEPGSDEGQVDEAEVNGEAKTKEQKPGPALDHVGKIGMAKKKKKKVCLLL